MIPYLGLRVEAPQQNTAQGSSVPIPQTYVHTGKSNVSESVHALINF